MHRCVTRRSRAPPPPIPRCQEEFEKENVVAAELLALPEDTPKEKVGARFFFHTLVFTDALRDGHPTC